MADRTNENESGGTYRSPSRNERLKSEPSFSLRETPFQDYAKLFDRQQWLKEAVLFEGQPFYVVKLTACAELGREEFSVIYLRKVTSYFKPQYLLVDKESTDTLQMLENKFQEDETVSTSQFLAEAQSQREQFEVSQNRRCIETVDPKPPQNIPRKPHALGNLTNGFVVIGLLVLNQVWEKTKFKIKSFLGLS